jgi:hypothetical protein
VRAAGWLALALAVGAFATTAAAKERAPFVRSRDGRLSARTVPEVAWCGDVVDIRLEGKPELFVDSPEFVEKFVGGSRAAVTAECPKAVAIRFHARDGDRVVFRGWSSKAGGWKILNLQRTPDSPPNIDVLREIARVEAMRLNALAGARNVKFASAADAGDAHAAWTISNVSLGLTIAEAQGAIGGEVAAAADEAAKACPKAGPSEAMTAPGMALRTFFCADAAAPYAWGLVGWESGEHHFMLGLWAPGTDSHSGANLASVASTFAEIVAGNW